MKSLLFAVLVLSGIGAVIMGAVIQSNALSAVHEIEALIMFLIAAVSLGSAAIVLAVDELRVVPKPLVSPPPAPATAS